MAYTFPPKDDRPSSYPSPNSSNRSYFTEQAIRSGYSGRIDPRETEFHRYGTELREPVERETAERERIRAEIMEKEMARRRILEEEIRRELMLDREAAMKRWEASRMRGGDVVPSPSGAPVVVHDASRMLPVHPVAVAVPPGRSVVPPYVHEYSRVPQPLGGYYEGRMYPVMPMVAARPVVSQYQHHLMPGVSLGPREIKYPPENRKETSTLAKREANNSGLNMKRKASTLGADRPGGSNLEKKPKVWTCELCKISTTNEKGLNDHLIGKRHKLMVEGLPVQKIGIGSSATSDPLKGKKPKLMEEGLPVQKIGIGSSATRDPLKGKRPKLMEEGLPVQKIGIGSSATSDPLKGKKPKLMEEGLPVQKIGIGSTATSDPEMKKAGKAYVKPSENNGAEATVVDKKQISRQNSSVKIQQKPGPPPRTPIKVDLAKKPPPSTTPSKVDSAKFRFWCKMCQVGTFSEVVLAAHEKGKKHLAKIEELQKAARGSSSVAPMEKKFGNAQTTSFNKPKQQMKR